MYCIRLLSDEECQALWTEQDEKVKSYEEYRYCLSSFSKLSASSRQNPDGSVKEYNFPTFTYLTDIRILPENRSKLINTAYYHARRIRNYLASTTQHRMPIIWRILGKDFAVYHSFGDDVDAFSSPQKLQPMWEKTQEQIDAWFKERYSNTTSLLDRVNPETVLGRCLNLYGSAIWTDDFLDAYNYLWRIIELIANQEVKRIKQSEPQIIADYLSKKVDEAKDPCIKEKSEELGSRDKIIISYAKIFPESPLDLGELKEENKLRDEISHGDVTVNTYEREYRYSMKVWDLSRKFLQSELSNELKTNDSSSNPI